ncbi:MAG: ABC transporter ATP-binding protein [Deltaproteobacteria bacterium]|nr:ABC transporter ATP-binding protein [Deltaproteobacteria bacterium]
MSDAYLCLRDVVKSYDGRVNAVDGISIDVRKGEFLTLLGPSGSGKTTTLLMIAGFEELTDGVLELEGRSLANVRPYRRNIGMVFQNYALFPHMTTEINVAFPLRMRKFPREQIRPRVEKALTLVGLSEFATKYPRELSGGQQQRVALARALVFEPDVLLLDEPLGALDKNLREQMQVEIKRIHGEVGITTIYVTHDQTEAMTMSDRVAVFNDGKIEQLAPPLEMYHRPATWFVGNFIGDSNFFEAAVVDANAGRLAVDSLGEIVAAPPDGGIGAGRVHALVRPENVRLLQGGETGQGLNVYDMTVEGSVHYGDSVLVIGRVGSLPLRVRIPGAQAAAVVAHGQLRVGWRPEDVHVIPRAA